MKKTTILELLNFLALMGIAAMIVYKVVWSIFDWEYWVTIFLIVVFIITKKNAGKDVDFSLK